MDNVSSVHAELVMPWKLTVAPRMSQSSHQTLFATKTLDTKRSAITIAVITTRMIEALRVSSLLDSCGTPTQRRSCVITVATN
jgi:hypothetical protein